jgi:hypothetical protein
LQREFVSKGFSMTTLTDIYSWVSAHWLTCALVGGIMISALAYSQLSERDTNRLLQDEQRRRKELNNLANRICRYARAVHQRYPDGDVVVSEIDLAKQLRKPPAIVAPALNVLLGQNRAQPVALHGFWKLKV